MQLTCFWPNESNHLKSGIPHVLLLRIPMKMWQEMKRKMKLKMLAIVFQCLATLLAST